MSAPAAPAPPAPLPAAVPPAHLIHIVEPLAEDCQRDLLPPEGNVKLRNYRLLGDSVRAYTPTGDIHTSPRKGKLVPRYDVLAVLSPPRARILQLLRASDPGRAALEDIVRPAPRRALARPLDDDARRFLQRALLSPSPQGLSAANTPEPAAAAAQTPYAALHYPAHSDTLTVPSAAACDSLHVPPAAPHAAPCDTLRVPTAAHLHVPAPHLLVPEQPAAVSVPTPRRRADNTAGRSLADELREAEEGGGGDVTRPEPPRPEAWEWRGRAGAAALAAAREEGGGALSAAARRLDALLEESRALHAELAGISEDMQLCMVRAARCAAAARALGAESTTLRFLDDVVALLSGNVAGAVRARQWPFVIGDRDDSRNYVV
ncbi:hypothetical protein JYU34_002970 [Plutella xylostella]|uniref:Uncharacterized protein n=1 Tax=Plutella xylostella TaxID=51655 RepID=A0ABQ7R3L2_PLUXY|nr:hypothetical protein JYU34_002970 [Plutella xylostella]